MSSDKPKVWEWQDANGQDVWQLQADRVLPWDRDDDGAALIDLRDALERGDVVLLSREVVREVREALELSRSFLHEHHLFRGQPPTPAGEMAFHRANDAIAKLGGKIGGQ